MRVLSQVSHQRGRQTSVDEINCLTSANLAASKLDGGMIPCIKFTSPEVGLSGEMVGCADFWKAGIFQWRETKMHHVILHTYVALVQWSLFRKDQQSGVWYLKLSRERLHQSSMLSKSYQIIEINCLIGYKLLRNNQQLSSYMVAQPSLCKAHCVIWCWAAAQSCCLSSNKFGLLCQRISSFIEYYSIHPFPFSPFQCTTVFFVISFKLIAI